MERGELYGFVIGGLVAAPVVCLLDLRVRLNSRTEEERQSSDADYLIDYRRGGMLGCLPVWLVVWALPFGMCQFSSARARFWGRRTSRNQMPLFSWSWRK